MQYPELEWAYMAMMPLFVVAGGALVGLLVEGLAPQRRRFGIQAWLASVTIVIALLLTGRNWYDGNSRHLAGLNALSLDAPTMLGWAGILAFGLGAVVLAAQRFSSAGNAVAVSSFTPMGVAIPGSSDENDAEVLGVEHSEVFPIMLFALFGMLLFPAATDLVTAFIGLEVMSLPLYLLCALARRRRLLSHEAALKYFLLGAFSSAIFLYGVALTYGFSGTLEYAGINGALTQTLTREPLMLAGFGLLMVGMLFKVGAAPFHSWVPDVYTGAPTPVTAFMAVGTKVATFGALARLLYVAFGGLQWTWMVPLGAVAALTMAWGSIVGLTQNNIKRLLAYSSVSHAGFVLMPLAAALGVVGINQLSSMTALVYYLAAYGLATIGAFAIVLFVRDGVGEVADLDAWTGLGRRYPWVGAAMTLFMCSLAGIPLTAGFIGKLDAFVVAWRGGLWWLVIIGLVFSLVAMVFYMRVVATMWFGRVAEVSPLEDARTEAMADARTETMADAQQVGRAEATADEPQQSPPAEPVTVRVSLTVKCLIALCAAGTLVAGVAPDLFMHWASLAGQLLR